MFILQTSVLLLRIDDIVSGTKKQMEMNAPQAPAAPQAEAWFRSILVSHSNFIYNELLIFMWKTISLTFTTVMCSFHVNLSVYEQTTLFVAVYEQTTLYVAYFCDVWYDILQPCCIDVFMSILCLIFIDPPLWINYL